MTSLQWAIAINLFSLLLLFGGIVVRLRNRRRREQRNMKLHLNRVDERRQSQ